ncbi:MAG: hypothetical protein K9L28_04160 [Synergistales bacterium]|nr:hypothetical protein [Synergistales bacterium]
MLLPVVCAWSDMGDGGTEPDFSGYMIRMVFAIAALGVVGWMASRWYPRTKGQSARGVSLLAAVPVGKDTVRVVACGPEVIALLSSRSGTVVIGRWSREEWEASCRQES